MRARSALCPPERVARASWRPTFVVAANVWLAAPAVQAAPCPTTRELGDATAALAEASPGARLGFVRGRIEAAAKPSRQWALGWGVGLGLLTVAQLAIAPLVDPEEAPDYWMGALASGIGAASRAIFIPHVLLERRRMRKRGRHGDVCAQLAAAEHAMVRAAAWERRGKALWQHFLSIAVNAGVGVALGVGFGRQIPGARIGAIGATVGEIMILTQPVPMMKAQLQYQSGVLAPAPAGARATWGLRPLTLRGGGGVAIGGRM